MSEDPKKKYITGKSGKRRLFAHDPTKKNCLCVTCMDDWPDDAPFKVVKGRNGSTNVNRSTQSRREREAHRHGLRSGVLPKELNYISISMNVFRRHLEDELVRLKGSIDVYDAATVQTVIRWERHACVAQRWLTKEFKKLSPIERLKFSEAIAKASSERDKAIERLQLPRDKAQNALDALYTSQDSPDDEPQADTA